MDLKQNKKQQKKFSSQFYKTDLFFLNSTRLNFMHLVFLIIIQSTAAIQIHHQFLLSKELVPKLTPKCSIGGVHMRTGAYVCGGQRSTSGAVSKELHTSFSDSAAPFPRIAFFFSEIGILLLKSFKDNYLKSQINY